MVIMEMNQVDVNLYTHPSLLSPGEKRPKGRGGFTLFSGDSNEPLTSNIYIYIYFVSLIL